jgi:hypothetical protein
MSGKAGSGQIAKGASRDVPRARKTRRMSELLPDVGGVTFRRFGFVQHAVVSRWGEIVGEKYAHVTAPESIRFPKGKRADGVLSLTVVPAHAPMMQHVLPLIIERVNRFFGYAAVAKVSLQQGEIISPARRAPVALPKMVSTELGESLKSVGDPELKAVLEALAQGIAAKSAMIPVVGKVR